jgi:hypothetical protein
MGKQNKHIHTKKNLGNTNHLDNNNLIGATETTMRIERKVYLT